MTIRKTPQGFMASNHLTDDRGMFTVAGFGPTRLEALQDYLTTCRTLHLTGERK